MKTVELHPAHIWTCEECGRDNYCRSVFVEMTKDESRELMEEHGIDPNEAGTGNWVTAPEQVRCEHCGAEFSTQVQQ